MKKIDRYEILETIGSGGMGEILLVKDPICQRKLALKRIKDKFIKSPLMQKRFLREARIASRLTHPSIISIYSIHQENDNIFYTMPYIQGETLKAILQRTKTALSKGEKLDPIGGSIPQLIRIFLSICEAISYTHANKIIHRDIKPENIIIGTYGEVILLDWGIAQFATEDLREEENETIFGDDKTNLTMPGKFAGTLHYLPPERVFGKPSTYSTDLYALGVLLYQILTLHLPFHRPSIQEFKKWAKKEKLIDPTERAPYREIPHELSQIAIKALSFDQKKRYQTTAEMIADVNNYIEGTPHWTPLATLKIEKPSDWAFQEHLLLNENIEFLPNEEEPSWAFGMISKQLFPENIAIKTSFFLEENCEGIGFLINAKDNKPQIKDGYLLWIHPSAIRLYLNNILIEEKQIDLKQKQNALSIEKRDQNLFIYLNKKLIFVHTSHLPHPETHIGFFHKDLLFKLEKTQIYSGSQNITVNCLAIPDAFFAKKDFNTALQKYREIGISFPGRTEGREALFRAGITLCEKAKICKTKKEKNKILDEAYIEFEKLSSTPGAPFEYLGKAITYQILNNSEEEANCLELALRKFPRHPLLHVVYEHIYYRLLESLNVERDFSYRLLLIIIMQVPMLRNKKEIQNLITALFKNFQSQSLFTLMEKDKNLTAAIMIALLLKRAGTLFEIFNNLRKNIHNESYLIVFPLYFCVLKNEALKKEALNLVETFSSYNHISKIIFEQKRPLDNKINTVIKQLSETPSNFEIYILLYLLESLIFKMPYETAENFFQKFDHLKFNEEQKASYDALKIYTYLFNHNEQKASKILFSYSQDTLTDEQSPLFGLYGLYMYFFEKKEKAIKHFQKSIDLYDPPIPTLIGHFILQNIDLKIGWIKRAFFLERNELYKQLFLFYSLNNDESEKEKIAQKIITPF
ncbi:MAG TPA: protein kinase [Chlamydiales bacterium]|nr:protein kinase [Chlamydiales bacterium]